MTKQTCVCLNYPHNEHTLLIATELSLSFPSATHSRNVSRWLLCAYPFLRTSPNVLYIPGVPPITRIDSEISSQTPCSNVHKCADRLGLFSFRSSCMCGRSQLKHENTIASMFTTMSYVKSSCMVVGSDCMYMCMYVCIKYVCMFTTMS